MQKINYALIVSDFDGTLVRSDGTVSDNTKQIISQYVQSGGVFAISTGRMPAGILPRVKELGLKGIVCCGQGSAIVDIQTEEIISEGKIPCDIAVTICEKMEQMGLHIHVYDLWDYYSNMNDDALKTYQNIVKTDAILVTEQPISQFVKEKNMSPYKILAMVAPEDNEAVKQELEKQNFVGCEVTRSSVYLVEVGNKNYSKGTSLQYLAQKYGIDINKTIAVGDQVNDLSMIEMAGLGFAVKNADENLKRVAQVCDYTNNDDAVAHIIQKYGFLEE